jgi:signal peptidase I
MSDPFPAPDAGPVLTPNPAPMAAGPNPAPSHFAQFRAHLPTLPQALASLLQTVVVALFVLTFIVQPVLIPSESMERTLLVGDFLLFNKQIYAPADRLSRWLLPYRGPARGDIIVFRHPYPPMLIKRVVGLPGDRLRIVGAIYAGPQIDPEWWRQMRSLTQDGELTVPLDQYFVLGDNRNHSWDSRYWGFVPRDAVVGRPLVIYFSLNRPSTTDVEQMPQQPAQIPADDKLGHERELAAKVAAFARWRRIFHVVH